MSHRIADTRMRHATSEHWTTCTCGVRVEETTPEDLAESFRLHRLGEGARPRVHSRPLITGTGVQGFSIRLARRHRLTL